MCPMFFNVPVTYTPLSLYALENIVNIVYIIVIYFICQFCPSNEIQFQLCAHFYAVIYKLLRKEVFQCDFIFLYEIYVYLYQ